MNRYSICVGVSVAVSLLGLMMASASAAEPLHVRIDGHIESARTGPLAAPASDAEFLRRVSLDLTGMIPSVGEARDFLADRSPNKRTAIVDRLLASPRYPLHFANVFDVMLMERRSGKSVKSTEWEQYLRASFIENKPYNQLAREILAADGVDPKLRPAVKFYLDRGAETNLLTRDVGRMFFGKDLQCAQCHNHPLIDDYLQADYYGLFAFLNRGFIFTDKKKKTFFAEKAEGTVSFKSVFTGDAGQTRPRLPGDAEIVEPVIKKGEEYQVKPAKNVRPVPKYSRRARLAEEATSGRNRAFNRNIANRLWAHMMGRGLIDPVDLDHPDNPPSHPELLDLLADEFVLMKFDVKAFLRELALSRTYQRSVDVSGKLSEQLQTALNQRPALLAEQKRLAVRLQESQTALEQAEAALAPLKKSLFAVSQEFTKAAAAAAAAKKAADPAAKALAAAQQNLTTKQDLSKTLTDAISKTQAVLKQLPKDKELAAAAAKLQSRSKQLATELTAVKKTFDQRAAAAKTTGDKLAAAEKAVQTVTSRLETNQKQYDQAAAVTVPLRSKRSGELVTANVIQNRLASIQAFAENNKLATVATASGSAAAKAQAEFSATKQASTTAVTELSQRKSEFATAEKTHADSQKTLAERRKTATTSQQVVGALGEAAAKTKLALTKLPDDTELKQVVQRLTAHTQRLSQELPAVQKQVSDSESAAKSAAARLASARSAVDSLTAKVTALQQQVSQIEKRRSTAIAKLEADQAALDSAYAKLVQHWTNDFSIAALKPLPPEVLAWSFLQSTGMVDRQRTASTAEFNKKNPPDKAKQNDPAKRSAQIEQAVYDKLKGNVSAFVKLYGAGAGQPQQSFFATVDQALFLANGGQVRGWLSPSGGNLTDRLNKQPDPKALTEDLYLSVLTRRPTDAEIANVTAYLAAQPKQRAAAIQEIVWALLTSTEFRFSH